MGGKWSALVAVCIATFMLLIDITIVNVALPEIERSLDASFTDVQWVIDAYALALAALLLTAGSLSDLVGRRRIFVIGLGIFTVASLLCGLAGSPDVLNAARALQGVGGAFMFATSLALLAAAYQGRDRGTAIGIWGATIGAAVAIGPLAGGALTDGLGWESIFFVNIPIGIFAIVLTQRTVTESKDPAGGALDLGGLVTFSGALFLLVFALIRGNDEGWGSTPIVAMLVGSAALMAAFVAVERRQERGMLDLSLFSNASFNGASIAAFALSASMFAMFLYLTLYIQNVLGYTPLEAGMRFLPVTLVSFAVAPVSGKLAEKYGVRWFLAGGLTLVGVGLVLMSGLEAGDDWTALLAGFLVAGGGIGLTNPALATAAVGVVAPQRAGMASGINSTFRQVGIATGIAAWGAVFQHVISAELGGVESDAVVFGAVRTPEARAAFVEGLNDILVYAALVAFAGALLSLLLVRAKDFVAHGAPPEVPAA